MSNYRKELEAKRAQLLAEANKISVQLESSLEDDFKLALTEARQRIADEAIVAERALARAIEISESFGIPFDNFITVTSYVPTTFTEKWAEVEQAQDIIDEYETTNWQPSNTWQSSQMCY